MANILVVEDDAQVLARVAGILQNAGHKTLTATDYAEGLELIDGHEPLDLLFTDIYLKDNTHGGLELAQEAVKRRGGIRVLYTTGGNITDAMQALFVEGSAMLAKPYPPAELVSSIQRMQA